MIHVSSWIDTVRFMEILSEYKTSFGVSLYFCTIIFSTIYLDNRWNKNYTFPGSSAV